MKALLKAVGLNVGYNKKAMISDIDLDAMRGQVICLLGPNGAGKSTILKTLSGLLAPVSGRVELDGEDISKTKKRDVSKRLSVVMTEQPSLMMTTVYELVSMGRTPYTDYLGRLSEEDRRIVDDALKTTDIDGLRDRYFSELSDGEKQKALIARALVQQPDVMILDEPTSHLDIRYKIEVIRLLQRLANEQGITCILSLHDIDLAIKGCQTIMLVNGGRIVDIGSPEDIIKSGVIGRLYNIRGGGYNELLGSVELRASGGKDVFVVAGNGTGVSICRALARNCLGAGSGVLHENDKDYEAAAVICGETIYERAFEPISAEKLRQAKKAALCYRYTVDSGFPAGSGNRGNIDLLKAVITAGKTVFSLRPKDQSRELFGELAEQMIYIKDISEFLGKIKKSEVF